MLCRKWQCYLINLGIINNTICVALQPKSGLHGLIVEVSRSHTNRQAQNPAELLWISNQLVTRQIPTPKQQTQEMNVGEIRTYDLSNQREQTYELNSTTTGIYKWNTSCIILQILIEIKYLITVGGF